MKYLVMIVLAALITDPRKISRINSAKSKAKQAFQSGDYQAAIQQYTYLADSMGVKEDEILLNRAHAQYLIKDTANAYTAYQALLQSQNKGIVTKAANQLGLIANQKGRPEEALSLFKQAIRADPSNDDARYNYEMLKKKLDQKKKEDQQKQDEKNKDKDKDQEPSEFAKRLKEQADRLVAQRRYREAYDLMMDGLQKDETVSVYQKYIDRIKDVFEIND